MIGETIGHYNILEKLGQGGMGEVFLAQDTTLDRKVALKFLPEEMQQDPTARERFLREAKSAAALDHPFICKIYEVGEAQDRTFIAMEYIQGTTLEEKLTEGPLPVKDVLETVWEIADALEGAHRRNIVHRDLKPSNIMLIPEGHVKVMDFGLAKRVTPGGSEDGDTTVLTQDGAAVGTVPYMSPEQVRGQRLDTRSDIFSFGVLLYEMVTGVNPFKKGSAMDTAQAILNENPPPIARYADDAPDLLQHTLRKMLAKDRNGRHQTAKGLMADLRQLNANLVSTDSLISVSAGFGTGEPRRGGPWAKVAVGALVALVIMLTGFWYLDILNDRERGLAELPLSEEVGERITLAVLPFYAVNVPEEIGFLRVGLPDAIIARLANTEQLRLRPTNAILQYENQSEDLQEVGQALESEYVLTGTIQKAGERFRVTVQLVRTSDGSPIWGEHFDKLVSDLLDLQDSISQQVVAALEINMTASEQERVYKRHTQNAEAYELYLQGRSHLVRRNREETLAAVEAFEGALDSDPNNALAHAGQAMASVQMLRFAAESEVEGWGERAESQAARALELDPGLAQGHEVLAALYRHKEFEWEKTIEESRRTLEANPNLDMPHFYLASAFYHLGLLEMVDGELRQGQEINPTNAFDVLRTRGVTALLSGKFDEAVALLEEVQHLSSRPLSDPYLAQAYFYRGEGERAEQMLTQLLSGSAQAKRRGQAILASFMASRGEKGEAQKLVLDVTEGAYMDHHVAYSLGVAYAQLGDHAKALEWLTHSAETGFPCYPWYVNDRLLEPLQDNAEYQVLLSKLRQSWESAKERYTL